MDLNEIFDSAIAEGVIKLTLSKPDSDAEYRKITVSKTEKGYFAEQFTDKQVFHKIIEDLLEYLKSLSDKYLQINIWTSGYEHIVLISKKARYRINVRLRNLPRNQKHITVKRTISLRRVLLYRRWWIWGYSHRREKSCVQCTINSAR